jgi:hypothetical protein
MIESFSPIRAFINVDLPTLGLPIILTKPALCDIEIFFKINLHYKETNYIFAFQFGRRVKDLIFTFEIV